MAEALDLRSGQIEIFEVTQPSEQVQEAPSLLDLRESAMARRTELNTRLQELVQEKAEQKEASRVWHRIRGALAHLKELDANKAVLVRSVSTRDVPEDASSVAPPVVSSAAAEADGGAKGKARGLWGSKPKAATKDGVEGDSTPEGFVNRWLGVRDMVRAHVAVVRAANAKEERAKLKEQIALLDGRLHLITQLQEAALEWPDVPVPNSSPPILIDKAWNIGIEAGAASEEDGQPKCLTADAELTPRTAVATGRVCYYCAKLAPPVKAAHRFVVCAKRRRANVAEFLPQTLTQVAGDFNARADHSNQLLRELKSETSSAVAASPQEQKKELLELAGAIKVLGRQDSLLPRPSPPPPPPTSSRASAWRTFMRREQHTTEHLVKLIAHASRGESMAIRGAWGELKATALMTPQPAPLAGPLQPAYLISVGRSLGLDVSAAGSDHHMLHLIIELARAPIPVNWEPVDADDDAEGAGEEVDDGSGRMLRLPVLQHYVHLITGDQCVGHPATPQMLKVANGHRARSERKTGTNRQRPCDSWVEFADSADRLPYFYNFRTGERRRDFPILESGAITRCVLPPRLLEPSAQLLADAGKRRWGKLAADRAESDARSQLWDGAVRRQRGDFLAHQPCRLEVLIQQGHALGIDASQHPELMWMAECALTPQMPVGWLRGTVSGMLLGGDSGTADFYWNTVCGLMQWEHPHVSYLAGVAERLVELRAEEARRALMQI